MLLLFAYKYIKLLNSLIVFGTPVSWLLFIRRLVRLLKLLIVLGNDLILLLARFNVTNPVRSPSALVIFPERLFSERLIADTRSLLQVTPVQLHTPLKFHRLVLFVQLFPLVELKSCTNAIQSLSSIPVASIHIHVFILIPTLPQDFCGL